MHRFKDLEIWKQSRVFCSDIYRITSKFPDEEKFGITNELRRASISIPSNIAEGSSRSSNKEFCRFLEFGIGAAYEVQTQLLISADIGFLNNDDMDNTIEKITSIIKMMVKFKSTLK
ncbi:MAG: four helix bundle protein [Flavobacteriaceae bacterium]|nr:four helix bundle protein [Flavobacteriaceae bacterium]